MSGYNFFERQMAVYATYHRDGRNRVTHLFGVPSIIFAILVALGLWRWPAGGLDISAGAVIALLAFLLWLALDLRVGLVLILFLMPLVVFAEHLATEAAPMTAWTVVAVFFIGGWVLQLLGHVYEGRRPALVENVFQIFIAPMFLVAELLFALGLRRRLQHRVEACVADTYPEYARPSSARTPHPV